MQNIFEIKNVEDAKYAWDMFFGRFYSSDIPDDLVKFDTKTTTFEPRKNKNKIKKNIRASLDPNDMHSDDFDDFLNGNTVTIPKGCELNKEGLDLVEKALKEGKWENEIFNRDEHIFYSLWLFKLNKISRQQISTILNRYEVKKNSKDQKIQHYKIIDKNGNFTKEAQLILGPILKKEVLSNKDKHFKRFRLLIQALPKSENVFFTTKGDWIDSSLRKTNAQVSKRLNSWHQINESDFSENTDIKNDNVLDVHLSFGMRDARQIAEFGVYGSCVGRAMLGKITINDVKNGVENFYRPVAIHLGVDDTGVIPPTENIHEKKYTTMPIVTSHDVYHVRKLASTPSECNLAVTHMQETIIKNTGFKWSKLLWQLTDRDFLFTQNKDNSLFFQEIFSHDKKSAVYTSTSTTNLTDEGIISILHMVKNWEVWKKLYKININEINDIFGAHIKKMQMFMNILGPNDIDPKIINLKYRLFCSMKKSEALNYFKINESIIANINNDPNFKFEKLKGKNQIVLKYRDMIINEGNVKDVVSLDSDKNRKEILNEIGKVRTTINSKLEVYYKSRRAELMWYQQLVTELINSYMIRKDLFKILHENYESFNELKETIPESKQLIEAAEAAAINFFNEEYKKNCRSSFVLFKSKINEKVNEGNLTFEDIKKLGGKRTESIIVTFK